MISRSALYAVRAMAALARLPEGAHGITREIAEQADVPPSYLSKVLQALTRAGLVRSQKGLGGGFSLARDADEITLLDIVEPIDQISCQSDCILGRNVCSDRRPCAMHDEWKKIRQASLRLLGDTTVAGLVERDDVLSKLL